MNSALLCVRLAGITLALALGLPQAAMHSSPIQ
jgi:hypothetical protein